MRLLFFFDVLDRLFARVAPRLLALRPGLECDGVVYGRYGEVNLLEAPFRGWGRLWAFSDYVRQHAAEPVDLAYLGRIEEAYGPPNLNLLLAGERHSPAFGWRGSLRMLQHVFRFNQEVLEARPPDAILSEGIDCLLNYSLYLLARARGIPFLLPATRLPGRFALIRNPCDRWERAEACYAQFQEHFPDARRREAQAFLDDFRTRRPRMVRERHMRPPKLRLRDARALLRFVAARARDPFDYTLVSPVHLLRRRLERIGRTLAAERTLLSQQGNPGDRYAFFPLHFEPEAATLVLAPFAVDQPSVIAYVARSLPIGMRLYVKEHPVSVGRRPLGYYRRLAAIPNVTLISPWADTHQLLRGAALVTTIAGTAGWEGLLYDRPVITFGNTCYNAYPGVRHVTDFSQLPEAIRRLLATHRPDHEQLLRFVAAMLAASYPGDIQHPEEVPESLGDANVRRVTAAYAQELGLLGS